jgi:hypothetical protein
VLLSTPISNWPSMKDKVRALVAEKPDEHLEKYSLEAGRSIEVAAVSV